MQDHIVIRFAMTKGEGTLPAISQMNEAEKSDLRLMIKAAICFEAELLSIDAVKITELEFIYDGITALDGEDYGYRLIEDEGTLSGYPAPIIRFKTSVPVDPEEFRRSIFTSWFTVQTASMQTDDQEPYFAEDHNGYAAVLDSGEAEEWTEHLDVKGAFCGTRFDFPEGMPTGGHMIDGKDFALPPDCRTHPEIEAGSTEPVSLDGSCADFLSSGSHALILEYLNNNQTHARTLVRYLGTEDLEYSFRLQPENDDLSVPLREFMFSMVMEITGGDTSTAVNKLCEVDETHSAADFWEDEENSQSGEWFYDVVEDGLKTHLADVLGANFEPVRALFEDIGWSSRLITVSNKTFSC